MLYINPLKTTIHLHDSYVVKMILESAQMLSTTKRFYRNNHLDLYNIVFLNHLCTIWVRQSIQSYLWLFYNLKALL